jgi:hypothetical protein
LAPRSHPRRSRESGHVEVALRTEGDVVAPVEGPESGRDERTLGDAGPAVEAVDHVGDLGSHEQISAGTRMERESPGLVETAGSGGDEIVEVGAGRAGG